MPLSLRGYIKCLILAMCVYKCLHLISRVGDFLYLSKVYRGDYPSQQYILNSHVASNPFLTIFKSQREEVCIWIFWKQ